MSYSSTRLAPSVSSAPPTATIKPITCSEGQTQKERSELVAMTRLSQQRAQTIGAVCDKRDTAGLVSKPPAPKQQMKITIIKNIKWKGCHLIIMKNMEGLSTECRDVCRQLCSGMGTASVPSRCVAMQSLQNSWPHGVTVQAHSRSSRQIGHCLSSALLPLGALAPAPGSRCTLSCLACVARVRKCICSRQ